MASHSRKASPMSEACPCPTLPGEGTRGPRISRGLAEHDNNAAQAQPITVPLSMDELYVIFGLMAYPISAWVGDSLPKDASRRSLT